MAKGIDVNAHAKMQRAGADYVVSPTFIGGMRMASQMVRPAVVTFLDTMLRDKEKRPSRRGDRGRRLPRWPGRRVGESRPQGKDAGPPRRRQEGRERTAYEFNPPDSAQLREGDVLIFIASPESLGEIQGLPELDRGRGDSGPLTSRAKLI